MCLQGEMTIPRRYNTQPRTNEPWSNSGEVPDIVEITENYTKQVQVLVVG